MSLEQALELAKQATEEAEMAKKYFKNSTNYYEVLLYEGR